MRNIDFARSGVLQTAEQNDGVLRRVSVRSRSLIKLHSVPRDTIAKCRMNLRTKIYLMAENRPELLTKAKIPQPNASQSAGRKFREHINVTSRRVEIISQDRTEQGQRTNASLLAETGNQFAIDRDGQISCGHDGTEINIRASNGQSNCARN